MDELKNSDFSEILSEESVRRLELFFANTAISDGWKTKLKSVIQDRDDVGKVCAGMELFFANTDLNTTQRRELLSILGI